MDDRLAGNWGRRAPADRTRRPLHMQRGTCAAVWAPPADRRAPAQARADCLPQIYGPPMLPPPAPAAAGATARPPAIIVHGGAWNIPAALTQRSLAGVRRAAAAGYAVLAAGGAAVDAAQAAVVALEDDPAFDAGRGSVLNARREVEMDAVIMTEDPAAAESLRAGAVAAVSNVRNPVALARRVMDTTTHCLLVGGNADAFAVAAAAHDEGVALVASSDDLVTPEAVAEWEAFNKYSTVVASLFNGAPPPPPPPQSGHDTVGAVAIDAQGRIAAATSTGGITNKMPGRVGDSPIIGSGAFVDAEFGGVSTTGHGESIMKTALAKRALQLVEHRGATAADAADAALQHMLRKTGGRGGLIIIDAAGRVAHSFTTERMVWASVEAAGGGEVRSGIDRQVAAP
jgi:L-asparaginase / beta-aspartyl-peptidase